MIYITYNMPNTYTINGHRFGQFSSCDYIIPKEDLLKISFKVDYKNNRIEAVTFYYEFMYDGKYTKIEKFYVRPSSIRENFERVKYIYHTLDNKLDKDSSDYVTFLSLLMNSSNELLSCFDGEAKVKFNFIMKKINDNFYNHGLDVLTSQSYTKVGGSPYVTAGVAGALAGPAVGILAGVNKEEKNNAAIEHNAMVSYEQFNLKIQKEKLLEYYDQANEIIDKYPKAKKIWLEKRSTIYDKKIDDIIKRLGSTNSGGCYVATCVYGSYNCPEVWTLRRYRDYTLSKTWHGRLFIKVYYAISPKIVKLFGNTTWFKKICKGKLDNFVEKLQIKGVENTPYEDKKW